MLIHKNKKKKYSIVTLSLIIVIVSLILVSKTGPKGSPIFSDEEMYDVLDRVLYLRCTAILNDDDEMLSSLYDKSIRNGIWAYEHEVKRMHYLNVWGEKQGIRFIAVTPKPVIRYIREHGTGFRINFLNSTEYKYVYENEPRTINMFRIGTYHSMDIIEKNEEWLITREWYTDPFADSLNVNKMKVDDVKAYITSQSSKDSLELIDRRKEAVKYADKYVGAAGSEENGYSYNKKYLDYNGRGGDCANFASQILYEGGKFRKTYSWNYGKGATRSWVNAQGFKDYMLYSGRASRIAYGTYEQIYKASYKLEPGDFIAYERKGKVKHISVVTGADSKGYALVNCHNTDRYRVPWDLGWSNRGIKFWLVHVHY